MTNEMYNTLIRMLNARMKYWQEAEDFAVSGTYDAVIEMLQYAHANDIVSLSQFDYYD